MYTFNFVISTIFAISNTFFSIHDLKSLESSWKYLFTYNLNLHIMKIQLTKQKFQFLHFTNLKLVFKMQFRFVSITYSISNKSDNYK